METVTVTLGQALSNGSTILSTGWTFISGNAVLFGVCALGLVSAAVHIVKSLFQFIYLKGGDYMTEALASGVEILNTGWSFISSNAVLFGVCALGLVSAAVHIVKSLFQ